MELMTEHKIRHVPILDNDQLVGMVSIGDVVNRLIEIYAEENAQLRQYINTSYQLNCDFFLRPLTYK